MYTHGGNGIAAIYRKVGETVTMYYVLKDHLGSITALVDEAGTIAQEYSYDAWGNRRKPDTWENLTSEELQNYNPLISRGYTCHEHLDKFGMINMNGRLYDPVVGQMLSPDNNVSSTFAQSFNRYTYCNNNPLKYIDPSGQSAVGGNNFSGYGISTGYYNSPFIGGSYIDEQEYLSNNGIGCFYYGNFFGATGWIYGISGGDYIHFNGGEDAEKQLNGGAPPVKPKRETINNPNQESYTIKINNKPQIKDLPSDLNLREGGFIENLTQQDAINKANIMYIKNACEIDFFRIKGQDKYYFDFIHANGIYPDHPDNDISNGYLHTKFINKEGKPMLVIEGEELEIEDLNHNHQSGNTFSKGDKKNILKFGIKYNINVYVWSVWGGGGYVQFPNGEIHTIGNPIKSIDFNK